MQPIPTQTPAMIKPETHNEIVFLSTLFLVMDDEGWKIGREREIEDQHNSATIACEVTQIVVLFLSKLI